MKGHIFCKKYLLIALLSFPMIMLSAVLFAQVPILNKDEWYQPEFAKTGVDTIVIDSFEKDYFNRPTNKPLKIMKIYNQQGFIDFYEIERTFLVKWDNGKQVFGKYTVYNKFEYDKKNHLIKIHIGSSLLPQNFPEFLRLNYQLSSLKKNGGAIPDHYEKYINSNLNNLYSGLVVMVNSINFIYNATGQPTKHSVNFTIYGIRPIYIETTYKTEADNLTQKETKQESETLTVNGHNLEQYPKLYLISFK